jgi:nitroreductase
MTSTLVVGDIDEVLTTTRAVRKRLDLDRDVEPAAVAECVELARQAPIAENAETCRFIVIRDRGKRRAVAGVYRQAVTDFVIEPLRRRGLEFGADPVGGPASQLARVMASAAWLNDRLERVPVMILAGSVARPPAAGTGAHASGYYGSVYPALWSLQLALRSRGLGSSLTCIHLHYADQVAAILGLPERFTQVALLPVAYSVGTRFSPARRELATDQVLFWDHWGDGTMPGQARAGAERETR